MARPTEQSEGADSIPKPELNPLLNPLLADNMGRWAEVYFTSPPEKREEAVLELLHELETEKAAGVSSAGAMRVQRPIPPAPSFHVENEETKAYCQACGHENPVTHQFCGMCGSKLGSSKPEGILHRELPEEASEAEDAAVDARERDSRREHEFESNSQPDQSASLGPTYAASDLSLFQSLRSPRSEQDWEYEEPPSSPYRYYIAAVLAVVILVLGYMAWRGTQASQAGHEASPAPPSVAQNTPPAANNPAPTPDEPHPSSANKTEENMATKKETSASGNTASQPHRTEVARRATASAPPPETAPSVQPSSTQPSADFGAEELAMAQHFLNGTGGRGRDSAEAAKWLWKSMAKHNGEASLLLADLYLKGDGVSKNCDQGRVLLDSAARRGIAGAGERLRNLQAFGCH